MEAPMRTRTALAIYILRAAVHTWPLSRAPWSQSLNYNADAEQCAWTICWVARPTDPAHLFDGNIFAPERATLTYSDPMMVPGLIGAPVWWLSGSPVLTFNLVMLAGLVLTAWSGFFVATRWTGSSGAGLVAGALAAFNPHTLTRLPHTVAAHLWGLLFTLYFADRLVERPNRRDAIWLAVTVFATAATSIYWLD
jgi:hypothetical protein